MLKRLLFLIVMVALAACAPTVTDTPDNTGDTTDETGNPTSSVPTPTREGDTSDDGIDVVGDPGSGFGLGDVNDGDAGFVAEITGAEEAAVIGTGTINCENNVYVLRAELASFPQIAIILPEGASPGNFNLVDNTGDGTVASATVFFEDGRVFAVDVEGIVIVSDLATQAGQPVSGSFDFSASSGAESVNVRGEFDFVSGEDAIYCP